MVRSYLQEDTVGGEGYAMQRVRAPPAYLPGDTANESRDDLRYT